MARTEMYDAVESATKEIMEHYDMIVYMDDVILEYADGLVPEHYSDVIDEWKSVNEFDSENYSGDHDIIAQMQAVLYDWYRDALYESVTKAVEKLEEGE